jgi:hypothetical protein
VDYIKIRGTNCGDGETCPAAWRSSAGQIVYVGREVTDPAERAQLGIGPGETAVEVPPEIGDPSA